ncbi:MAG: hypothetical protein RLY30_99 [Pseudomonadota bacterium]|jgi:hydroxyacylglutathione hydrolase
MKIDAIDAFSDNIIWAFEGPRGGVVVVDPGDAAPVLQYLLERSAWLEGVLITHHHHDHVGGLEGLQAEAPRAPDADALARIPVYGPEDCVSAGVTHVVRAGDRVPVGTGGRSATTLAVPGHTQDHLAFFLDGPPAVLFSGDTLFAGGCGRLLEGTAEQMYDSLTRLDQLPAETLVYCAHEYTLSNLLFAAHAFPQSDAIQARLKSVTALRSAGGRSLPSTLGVERDTNPFLLAPDLESFRALRAAKDSFRPAAPPVNPL